ncbi:hypothetical protein FGB62_257g07 [Gracilaria domingensis]|nr:hypothetical protein FGB62_257g07 [Gracilaria domingensis]
MGTSRKVSPTPTRAQPTPDIQTPGWCIYNADEDSEDEACSALSPFNTSESNYVRLHQERADYERNRWQKSEVPVSAPRRKSSKPLKPLFPTPQECAYYLHTALATIAGSRQRRAQTREQVPVEYKAIIGAFSSVEEVLNAQIQYLSQHIASANPNSAKSKRCPLRPSPEKGFPSPFSPTVESGLSILVHITATFAAHVKPMLTELTDTAKKLDSGFHPNVSDLTFAALDKHFNPESSAKNSGSGGSKRIGNKTTSAANGPSASSEPTMGELGEEVRRLIPEQYTFLKANYALNPSYRLEGTNRSLTEIAASCEHADKFRPRTPRPHPSLLIETGKRPRVSGTVEKPAVAKISRKGKRGRPASVTPNGYRDHLPSPTVPSSRYSSQTPLPKRRKQEPVTISLPPPPLTHKPPSPSFRTTPVASDLQEPKRRTASASVPGYMRRTQNFGMAGPSHAVPSRQNNDHRSVMKHASYSPYACRLPSDARQKLRENVKRRPPPRTEEDEYGMRPYEIDDDEDEESVNSHSSRSPRISMSRLPNGVQKDSERCRSTQRITFHQVVDVDEPEVVEQPTVVDLDA